MRKCCIPGCHSNYMKPYVPTFLFPKDEARRKLWEKSIGRLNFKITNNIGVCIKHFTEDDVIRYDAVESGSVCSVRRKVKLKPNACPSVFAPTETSENESDRRGLRSPDKGALLRRPRRRRSTICSKNLRDIPTSKVGRANEPALLRNVLQKGAPTTNRPIITVLKAEGMNDGADGVDDDDDDDIQVLEMKSDVKNDDEICIENENISSGFSLRSRAEERGSSVRGRISPKKRSSSVGSNSSNGSSETGKASALASKRRKVEKQHPTVIGKKNDCYCWVCHKEGVALSCNLCLRAYHLRCGGETENIEDWTCLECRRIISAEDVESRSESLADISLEKFCMLLKCCLSKLKYRAPVAFHQPVPLEYYRDYPSYVINPMDLSTIERNIKGKVYGSTESFLSDVKWILHNSCVYNGPQHPLSVNAKSMVKNCEVDMAEIEVCPDCFLHACTRNKYWFSELCRKPHPVVWAKLKGFPYWPAKVVRIHDNNVDARFFGAHDRAWVPVSQCYHLSKEMPTTSKPKKKGTYDIALDELSVHVQQLKQKYGVFVYAPYRTPFDPNNKLLAYHGIDIDKISAKDEPFSSANLNDCLPLRGSSMTPASCTEADANYKDSQDKHLVSPREMNRFPSFENFSTSNSNDSDSVIEKKAVPPGIFEASKDFDVPMDVKSSPPDVKQVLHPESTVKYETVLEKLKRQLFKLKTGTDGDGEADFLSDSESKIEETKEEEEKETTEDSLSASHKEDKCGLSGAIEENRQTSDPSKVSEPKSSVSERLSPESCDQNLQVAAVQSKSPTREETKSTDILSQENKCAHSSDKCTPSYGICGTTETTSMGSSGATDVCNPEAAGKVENKQDNAVELPDEGNLEDRPVPVLETQDDTVLCSEIGNEVLVSSVMDSRSSSLLSEKVDAVPSSRSDALTSTDSEQPSLCRSESSEGAALAVPKKVDAFNLKLDKIIESCKARLSNPVLGIEEITENHSASSKSCSDDEDEEEDSDDSETEGKEASTSDSSSSEEEEEEDDDDDDEGSDSSSNSEKEEEEQGLEEEVTTVGKGSPKSSLSGDDHKIESIPEAMDVDEDDTEDQNKRVSSASKESDLSVENHGKTVEAASEHNSTTKMIDNHTYCSRMESDGDSANSRSVESEAENKSAENGVGTDALEGESTAASPESKETQKLSGITTSDTEHSEKIQTDDKAMSPVEGPSVSKSDSLSADETSESKLLCAVSENSLQVCDGDIYPKKEIIAFAKRSGLRARQNDMTPATGGELHLDTKSTVTESTKGYQPVPYGRGGYCLTKKPDEDAVSDVEIINIEDCSPSKTAVNESCPPNIDDEKSQEMCLDSSTEKSCASATAVTSESKRHARNRPTAKVIDFIELTSSDSEESDEDTEVAKVPDAGGKNDHALIDICSDDEVEDDADLRKESEKNKKSMTTSSDEVRKRSLSEEEEEESVSDHASKKPKIDVCKNKDGQLVDGSGSENNHLPVCVGAFSMKGMDEKDVESLLKKPKCTVQQPGELASSSVVTLDDVAVNKDAVHILKTDGDSTTKAVNSVHGKEEVHKELKVCSDSLKDATSSETLNSSQDPENYLLPVTASSVIGNNEDKPVLQESSQMDEDEAEINKEKEVSALKELIRVYKLRIKKMEWYHSQEKAELRHNMNLMLAEMRASLKAEKKISTDTLQQQHEEEIAKVIDEMKSKQWCANCKEQAIFHCCWNTSYCSYSCQKHHWPQHRFTCSQIKSPPPLKPSSKETVKVTKSTASAEVTNSNADNKKVFYVNVRPSEVVHQTASSQPVVIQTATASSHTEKISVCQSGGQKVQLVTQKTQLQYVSPPSPALAGSQNSNPVLLQNTSAVQLVISPVKPTEKPLTLENPIHQKPVQDSSEIITKVRSRQTDLTTAIQLLNKMNKETEETLKKKKKSEDSSEDAVTSTTKSDELLKESPIVKQEKDSSGSGKMVPFMNGIEINEISLKNCLQAGVTANKLTRCLVDTFFPNLHLLAKSSVFGEKSTATQQAKPALPTDIVNAILDFVMSNFPLAKKDDLVVTIDMKCKEARSHLAKYNSKYKHESGVDDNSTEDNKECDKEEMEEQKKGCPLPEKSAVVSETEGMKSEIAALNKLLQSPPKSEDKSPHTSPTLKSAVSPSLGTAPSTATASIPCLLPQLPRAVAPAIRTVIPSRNLHILPTNKTLTVSSSSNRIVVPRVLATTTKHIAIKPKPVFVAGNKSSTAGFVQIPSSNIVQVVPAFSVSPGSTEVSPTRTVYVSGSPVLCAVKSKSDQPSGAGQCMQTTAINQPVMSVRGSSSSDEPRRPVVILNLASQQQRDSSSSS